MVEELGQLGTRLRAFRHAKGWTLEELASRAAMSPSTLSRLESGKRQATLELLIPLTRQLGISIDELIAQPNRDPRIRRRTVHHDGVLVVPLTNEDSPVATYKITYPPTENLPELRIHQGYEWLYVLSGRLRLRLGDQDLTLSKGEAAEFDTTVPHAMSAAGKKPVQILSIFNNDGVKIHTYLAAAEELTDLPDGRAVVERSPRRV